MRQFIKNHLEFTDIKEGQKVGCVAHSSFLKVITAEGLKDGDLIGGADMKNCAIFPDTTFKL
jgi:hypothetical protein